MEEYEQLEEELNAHYETYLTHFRNLAYLESLKEDLMHPEDANFKEDTANDLLKIKEVGYCFGFFSQLKKQPLILQCFGYRCY